MSTEMDACLLSGVKPNLFPLSIKEMLISKTGSLKFGKNPSKASKTTFSASFLIMLVS